MFYVFEIVLLSLGCVLLVVYGAQIMWEATSKYRGLILLMGVLLISVGTCKTISRNRDWYSREYLLRSVSNIHIGCHVFFFLVFPRGLQYLPIFHYRAGLKVLPHNAKMHYNFGNFLRDSLKHDTATLHYREALRLVSLELQICNGLIWADIRLTMFIIIPSSSSFSFYRLWPSYASAHNNLGTLVNNVESAERHFLSAILYASEHINAHFNLGQLYL